MLQDANKEPGASAGAPPEEERRLRWGLVLLIALPLIVINAFWISNSEMRTNVTEITISTLFSGVLFFIFLIALANLLVRRIFGPKRCLTQPEMLVLYVLLSLSSVISGVGNIGFLTSILVTPFYYGNPQNGWVDFWHNLPWFIGPRDKETLAGYFGGHDTFFRWHYIRAWAGPLAVWSLFLIILLYTLLCISVIVRRRWADEEHLPFPVVALPLALTRSANEGDRFFKSRLLWLGFAIPCFLHSLNTLASINPNVPSIQVNHLHDLQPALTYPWSGVDDFFYLVHGAGIGFGYLIDLDVSFSLWFFYLAKKATDVLAVCYGWRTPGHGWSGDSVAQLPYTGFQGLGAWLALGGAVLWRSRHTIGEYLKQAKSGEDTGEVLSPRMAVVGFIVGFLALCTFVWSMGGSPWLPVAFLALYVLIMLALTRIRAEAAVLSTELAWINPQTMLTSFFGTDNFSRTDLSHIAALSWFNTDYRTASLPHLLEGQVALKRAQAGRLRPLLAVMAAAVVVALAAALIATLQLYYVNGAATAKVQSWRVTGKGIEPWHDLQIWLQNPSGIDFTAICWALVGALITLGLSALRMRSPGFPLHPAGYVLNTSFANDFFWMDMFWAWLIKAAIVRYGGIALYRRGLPFFLGLILGDFVTGAFWSIVGVLLHLDLYRTFAI